MAETSGFFEAELNEETNKWDREYFASQFAAYFRLFFGNGVFGSPTNQLQVIAGEGLNVIVRAGWAFIEGYWYYNDSDLELVVSPNTSAFDRIDSVVCRLNVAERKIKTIVVEDTTEVVRDGNYYDLKLANITLGVAATSVTDANIVDTRMDESVCGIVTSVMKIQPTADLFAQFTDMFNTWFEGIKEQLSTDAAGNLQNQIGLLDELHTEDKTSLVNAINELLVRDVDVLDTYEEIMANTTPGKSAGGLGVKEGFIQLNDSLQVQEVTVTTDGTFNGICTLKNNTIKLNGHFTKISLTSNGWTYNTIKIPYAPIKAFQFPIVGYSSAATHPMFGYISTDGSIAIYSPSSVTEFTVNLVYDVN